MIFLIIFIAVLLLAIFLYLQNNLIDVTKYRLKSDNIINRTAAVVYPAPNGVHFQI